MKHSRYLQSSIFSWKKRGVTSRMLLELGGMIFAAIVILIFYSFGANLLSIFLKDPATELAKGNFNALTSYIDEVLNDKLPYSTEYGKPITIPINFLIMGFDKNWDTSTLNDACYDSSGKTVLKPTVCGSSSCIVLMKDMDFGEYTAKDLKDSSNVAAYQHNIDKSVVASKVYDNVDFFSGAAGDNDHSAGIPGNWGIWKNNQLLQSYFITSGNSKDMLRSHNVYGSEYLDIYGICTNIPTDSWGVRNLYIEKFQGVDSSNNYFTQIYIAKESDLTTERSIGVKAIVEFYKFVDAYNSCKSSLSVQGYSQQQPYIISSPCLCSPPDINLPQKTRINIENGDANLYLFDSSGNEQLMSSVNLDQPVEMQNNERMGLFSTHKKDKFDIYSGDSVSFYKSGNSVDLSLNEETPIIDNACTKADQAADEEKKSRAIAVFDSFSSAYQHYSPSKFLPAAAGTSCIMGRFSFEDNKGGYTLPEGYTININKAPETNTISLYDPDSKLVKKASFTLYNPPCYIDSSGNIQPLDYLHLSKTIDQNSLSDYTSFFIDGAGNQCFERETAPALSLPYCDWAKKDSNEKNADAKFQSFASCLENSNMIQTDCSFNAQPALNPKYALLLRKDSNSGLFIIVSLLKDGYIMEEKSVTGAICSPTSDTLNPSCDIESLQINYNSQFKVAKMSGGFVFYLPRV